MSESDAGYSRPRGIARIPQELCEQVIDYVAGYYDLNDSIRTLLACSLTCHRWVHRARRHLYHFAAVAKTKDQFSSLLQRADTQPGFLEIRVLDVGYDLDPAQAPAQTWMCTVPEPLTRRFPHIRRLRLACIPPVVHRSFYVSLSHFPSLTGLLLYGCRFVKFRDFARLILSFRTLKQLYLSKLEWAAEVKAGSHSLACRGMKRMTQLRLEHLNMTISEPHVMVDIINWLLCTVTGSSLRTVSIDFPAIESRAIFPTAVARLVSKCAPTLENLRLRFDSVKDGRDCEGLLRALDLSECTQLRSLSTRALPPDEACIDALVSIIKMLPSKTSMLEDVLLWNHGRQYFLGFPWSALDETLSDSSKYPRFRKLSVTVDPVEDAVRLAPQLCMQGKVALHETDSDHGEQFRFW